MGNLSIAEKKSVIQIHPVFCLLSDAHIHKLAEITEEIVFKPDEFITREGDLIDSVYFIVKGKAEVFKTVDSSKDIKFIKVATLTTNDAIGLNESGFFSNTLFRTAMVKAVEEVVALKINLIDFQKFLTKPSVLYPALKTVNEKILFMYFMQKSGFLQQFSQEQIQSIANKTEKRSIKKNAILFKQNDKADKVYFLLKGNVQIINTDYGYEHILKIFEPPNIFGESAFLKEGYRNATAKTETDCDFFILDVNKIQEIMDKQSENALFEALGTMRIKQLRPKKIAKEIQVEDILILEDKKGYRHKLSEKESKIYLSINKNDTLAEILNKPLLREYELTLHDLYDEMLKFYHMGIIELPIKNLKQDFVSHKGIKKWIYKLFRK